MTILTNPSTLDNSGIKQKINEQISSDKNSKNEQQIALILTNGKIWSDIKYNNTVRDASPLVPQTNILFKL